MQQLQQKMASRRNKKAQKKAALKENRVMPGDRKPQLGLRTRHNTPLLAEIPVNVQAVKLNELPQKRQFRDHRRAQHVVSNPDHQNKMSPSKRAKTERYSANSSIG